MSAVAKVWSTGVSGRTWMVHVKDDYQWVRVTGLRSEQEAIWEADALVAEFDALARPAVRRLLPSTTDRSSVAPATEPKKGPVT